MRFPKRVGTRAAIVWVALLSVFAWRDFALAGDAETATKDEQARLEGVWSFTSVKVNGQPQPVAGHEADRMIFQKDGRFTVVQRPGITHGTFKVNPGHTPKQYDVRIETGRLKGISVPAIYELAGDTLTICMPLGGSERPTVLESKPSDGHLFEVFKRERETVKEALIAAGHRDLTGTWQAEAYALDGKPASADDLKKIQLVFDAEGNTKALNDGKLFIASSTKIDPTASPATIDITFTGGEGKGGTALGIYKLEGNLLTICRAAPGKPRPTEFSSNPGSDLTLMSYRKSVTGPKHVRPMLRTK
jgi:uncharacterized protein (TIGR03067 family)